MKTMKSLLIICLCLFSICLLIAGLANSVQATKLTFFDDFNDGNTDGWISAVISPHVELGNWRVENQQLIQDKPGDGKLFLLNTPTLFSQSVETKIFPFWGAGAGFIIWYNDSSNFVLVILATPYWNNHNLFVAERTNGVDYLYLYDLDVPSNTWYTLKVDTNSHNGKLKIYLNDEYFVTQELTTTNQTGLTGLATGNAGAMFDDFLLTSNVPASNHPIPPTVLLFGSGLLVLAGWRRFRHG